MLDLFLSDKYKSHWPEIQKLAADDSPEAFEKLRKYALEGYRLATPAFGLLRIVDADTTTVEDAGRTINVEKGDQIYVDFVSSDLFIKLRTITDVYCSPYQGHRRCGPEKVPRPGGDQA